MASSAAGLFAQTTRPFEEVALKFIDVGDQGALLVFLSAKLAALQPSSKTQRTMVATWMTEIHLAMCSEAVERASRAEQEYTATSSSSSALAAAASSAAAAAATATADGGGGGGGQSATAVAASAAAAEKKRARARREFCVSFSFSFSFFSSFFSSASFL